MTRAGGLRVDARRADRSTYIRASVVLPGVGKAAAYSDGRRLGKMGRVAMAMGCSKLSVDYLSQGSSAKPRAYRG